MKPLLSLLCLSCLLGVPSAFAQTTHDAVPSATADHAQHLRSCRLQAKRKGLSGKGREGFMARCIAQADQISSPAARAAEIQKR